MGLNRTPPQPRSHSHDESHSNSAEAASGQGRGMIAAAINMLPVDVGTSVSPTVFRPSLGNGSNICCGGPGNTACDLEVKDGQQGVQCDLCGNWYHAFCQDITKGAYNALKKHEILSFICDSCKKLPNLAKLQPRPHLTDASVQMSPSHDSSTLNVVQPDTNTVHVISELVKKVENLELAVKDLTAVAPNTTQRLRTQEPCTVPPERSGVTLSERPTYADTIRGNTSHLLTQRHNQPPPRGVPITETPNQMSHDYRKVVREELRELEERKKRQHSLVIRGLRVKTATEAVVKFGEVTRLLVGETVTISEVCQIRTDTDLFRGNVHDVRQRSLVLEQASNLRSTQFSHVYIRKDLTFIQRQELHDKLTSRARQTEWHRTAHHHPGDKKQSNPSASKGPAHPPTMVETVPKQLVAESNSSVPPTTEASQQSPNTSEGPKETVPKQLETDPSTTATPTPTLPREEGREQAGNRAAEDSQSTLSQTPTQGDSGN